MKKNISTVIISLIFMIGVWGSGNLVLNEFNQWDICPVLFWVPACYIIFGFFVALFFIHLTKLKSIYFYIVALIPAAIALYASIFQLLWSVECPKTDWGVPMCFISLGLFSGLIICKYMMQKNNFKNYEENS